MFLTVLNTCQGSLPQYVNSSIFQYFNIPMFQYFNVQMWKYFKNISRFQKVLKAAERARALATASAKERGSASLNSRRKGPPKLSVGKILVKKLKISCRIFNLYPTCFSCNIEEILSFVKSFWESRKLGLLLGNTFWRVRKLGLLLGNTFWRLRKLGLLWEILFESKTDRIVVGEENETVNQNLTGK